MTDIAERFSVLQFKIKFLLFQSLTYITCFINAREIVNVTKEIRCMVIPEVISRCLGGYAGDQAVSAS